MGPTILPPLSCTYRRYATVGIALLNSALPLALAAAFEDAAEADADSNDASASQAMLKSALQQEQEAYMTEEGFSVFQQTLPKTPRDLADYVIEKRRRQSSTASLAELSRAESDEGRASSEVHASSSSLTTLTQDRSAKTPFRVPHASFWRSLLSASDTCIGLAWYGYGSVDECRDTWSPELTTNCRCERQGTAWPAKYCTTGTEGETQLALLGLGSSQEASDDNTDENIAREDVWGRCETCCSRDHFVGKPLWLALLTVILICLNVVVYPILGCLFPGKAAGRAAPAPDG